MDVSSLVSALVSALLLPFQLVLSPIDALLNNINGIEVIPQYISSIGTFIGTIPQTLVSLIGLNPLIWNATLLVFVAYIGLAPAINGVKKIIAWIT